MNESKRVLWEEHFRDHENSGMSVDAWCTKNQISKHRFYYWKKCLQQAESITAQTHTPVLTELALLSPPPEAGGTDVTACLHVQWKEFHFILTDTNGIQLAAEFIKLLQQP